MSKTAVFIAVLLCAFSFSQEGKGNFAAIGEVVVDALPDTAVITIPVKEGSELLKDAKINLDPIVDSKNADKYQLIIDMMPAALAGDALEKQVVASLVTSFKVSQYAAQPQKVTRILVTLTDKCDFQKEIDSTKIVVTLAKSKEPVQSENKTPMKALSLEESTKKLGEQVAQSEEVDKTDQFALQKGTMKKGDLEQIVPFISLTNADLTTFLNTIVSEAGFNLVTSRSVSGSIPSIQLKSVSLKKILDLVLKQNGFAYKLEGNIIRVATPSELKA
ncbi:MAG: STN domain-containing protein, partial [Candidatus Firestonebacteria bacterium]